MELFKISGTIGINNEEAKKKLKETTTQAQKAAQNISKGFNSVGQVFSDIGKSLTEVGKTASVVTTAIAGVMAASFAKAKSFIGTYESAMTVFTRKLEGGEVAAGKMYDTLVTIAKGSAFAQEYLVSAGQTLVAMGLDADTTSKYVQAATDAISGMGGSGVQVQEMATLFAKISQQTNLYTQDIQQMVERGIPAWDILATKYGTTTDKVKEMASDGLIPATESLNTITGALEETNEQSEYFKYSVAGLASELKSGTLTGSLDSLNSSFRTFALSLLDLDPRTESGKENIAKLNEVVSNFGETLEKIGSRFSFIGEWAGEALNKITNGLESFNETLDKMPQEKLEALSKIVLGIAAAGPALLIAGKAFSIVGGVISGIGSTISTVSTWFSSLSGAISTASAACGGLAPFLGIVAAAVAAIIGVIVVLKENWDKVVQTFQTFIANTGLVEKFNQIKEAVTPLWEKIQGLKDLFIVIGTTVLTALQPAFALIAGAFNGIVSAIAPLMTAIGGLLDILGGLGTFIVSIFTGDLQGAGEAIKKIGQGIVDVFGGLWDSVCALLTEFVDGVIQWFTSLWDTLVGHSIVPDTINAIIEWFGQLLLKPIEFVKQLKEKVAKFFNDLKSKVVEIVSNLVSSAVNKFNDIKEKASSIFNTIKSTIVNAWNTIKSTTSNVWNGIKTAIETPINKARDIVKNAIDKIKGFFNFNFSWPKLKLPHFGISPSGWKIGDLLKGSIPKLSIDWYAKAMDDGMILNEPTIFGLSKNGTLLGGGEAGSETIVGTESLMDMIQTATNNNNMYLAELLEKILTYLQATMPELSNRQLVLDTGTIAGALTPVINKNLGTISASMARGRSY